MVLGETLFLPVLRWDHQAYVLDTDEDWAIGPGLVYIPQEKLGFAAVVETDLVFTDLSSSTTTALKHLYIVSVARDPSAAISLKIGLGTSASNYKQSWGSLISPQWVRQAHRQKALQSIHTARHKNERTVDYALKSRKLSPVTPVSLAKSRRTGANSLPSRSPRAMHLTCAESVSAHISASQVSIPFFFFTAKH